jgi:hypothetical protein
MSIAAILFILVCGTTLLVAPRRWAPLPFLVGACYMTLGEGFQLGPFHFNIVRALVFLGGLRVLARGERIRGKLLVLDKILIAWGIWSLLSSAFHNDPVNALVYRLGVVYTQLGIYFLVRTFCYDEADVFHCIQITAILLAPLALEMVQEQLTGHNIFTVFGGLPAEVMIRDGKLRSQGPFRHPILAGTVGGVCIPLMVAIWRQHRKAAIAGVIACLLMVATSASSGPMMSALVSVLALALWPWRRFTPLFRKAAVVVYFILELVMNRPAYFIVERFDLTGSSTAWYRAELIRSSLAHLDEWWFAGTDYTRHWMATGVAFSSDSADITSQYIVNGVHGGLPLMGLFIAAVIISFVYISRMISQDEIRKPHLTPFHWAVGCCLFSHAITFFSVAYFDQTIVFFYTLLGSIGSLYHSSTVSLGVSEVEDWQPLDDSETPAFAGHSTGGPTAERPWS